MENKKIIVALIQIACFYTVISVMEATVWGIWSWQAFCVYIALTVMGLVNYADGLYKS